MESLQPDENDGGATFAIAEVAGRSRADTFARYMESVPAAFAVTRGAAHTLVYANAAFRRLTAQGTTAVGRPITEAFATRETSTLIAMLDRTLGSGTVVRDQRMESDDVREPVWCCTVWPDESPSGKSEYLIIEMHMATEIERSLALQQEVAERMLLSALTARDSANDAEASSRRATFLAAEGRRLVESLDETATLSAIARLALPHFGAWCIVDIITDEGAMSRLAITHSDPEKQELLRGLEGRWKPERGDPFGIPAVRRTGGATLITDDVEAALVVGAHDPEILRVLQAVGIGQLLTVSLAIRDRVVGALTFVSEQRDYSEEDVNLAEALASRSALALENARLFGETIALRTKAEAASQAKSDFLATMSHELRTPLNAIGGYVELLDMGLRGPVTEAQRADLARIKSSQQHLAALITDVLDLVRLGRGAVAYDMTEVPVKTAIVISVGLVEPVLRQKMLVFADVICDPSILAHADHEKLTQILVNLLSNAIKFTPAGGRISICVDATDELIHVRVIDTGIGISEDRHQDIFEPFVQVRNGLADRDHGVGLGLAISRDMARGMGGDVTVESALGAGSTFTLRLNAADSSKGSSRANP